MVGNVICVLSCEVLFLFQTASGILLCSVCSQIGDPSVKRQQIAKNVERLVQTLLSDSPTTKQEVSGKTSLENLSTPHVMTTTKREASAQSWVGSALKGIPCRFRKMAEQKAKQNKEPELYTKACDISGSCAWGQLRETRSTSTAPPAISRSTFERSQHSPT